MTERKFENMVEAAEKLARAVHKGQTDKAGIDYIEHPKAVASMVSGEKEKTAAWLHDTVEDTEVTLEQIESMFGREIAEAVDCLTHRDGESYMEYVARAKANPIARQVKMADLTNNMNLSRLKEVTPKDLERVEKYKKAMALLRE